MKKGFTHESTYNESKEWYTPAYIFDALGVEFDLDPCSPGAKIVPWIPAKRHLAVEDNGRMAHWEGSIWLNPPYGQDTPEWMNHLCTIYEVGVGCGIALVFCRSDTRWFHKYVPKADAVCFIKGRVQFIPADYANEYVLSDYRPYKGGGCGAASMLIAYGVEMAEALFNSGLGLTLPVSKNAEKFRAVRDFAGGGRRPHENLPRLSENRQGALFGGK